MKMIFCLISKQNVDYLILGELIEKYAFLGFEECTLQSLIVGGLINRGMRSWPEIGKLDIYEKVVIGGIWYINGGKIYITHCDNYINFSKEKGK